LKVSAHPERDEGGREQNRVKQNEPLESLGLTQRGSQSDGPAHRMADDGCRRVRFVFIQKAEQVAAEGIPIVDVFRLAVFPQGALEHGRNVAALCEPRK